MKNGNFNIKKDFYRNTKLVDDGVVYSNVSCIDHNKAYGFFLGKDVKYAGTTPHLKETLEKKYQKPVEIIHVLPNIPPPYKNKDKVIVINRHLAAFWAVNPDQNYFLPVKQNDLNIQANQSEFLKGIAERILKNQQDLYVDAFSIGGIDYNGLIDGQRIHLIGGNPKVFDEYDDKTFQRRLFEKLRVPVPQGYMANDFDELVQKYRDHFFKDHGGKAFVAASRGSGGNGVAKIYREADLQKLKNKGKYVISELIDVELSPFIMAIADRNGEVSVVGMADQILDDGTKYRGAISPSKATKSQKEEMIKYAKTIGQSIPKRGLYGTFGVDYMIDKKGNVYVAESNFRKIGSTASIARAYRAENPDDISLSELEFRGVIEGDFGIDVSNLKLSEKEWAVVVKDAPKGFQLKNNIKPELGEGGLFKYGGLDFYDFPIKSTIFLEDSKMGRAVYVPQNGNVRESREKVMGHLKSKLNEVRIDKLPLEKSTTKESLHLNRISTTPS